MESIKYVSVDTILGKFHRDIKDDSVSETDLIEYIGEAMEYLNVHQVQEQGIAFIEVKDYSCQLPKGLQYIIQIARNNDFTPQNKCEAMPPIDAIKELQAEINSMGTLDCVDCEGFSEEVPDFISHFETQTPFVEWITHRHYKEKYTPVRLGDHTFFNSLVCKDLDGDSPYSSEGEDYNCPTERDEYTIVGTTQKELRFSFREGYIAIAYVKSAVDPDTGYPLIPDNIRYINAVSYYLKWKLAETMQWNGREGAGTLASDNERKWLKYVRQANNYSKMPKTVDDFQDLLEQSHYLIPRHRRYYGFFGNLNQEEDRNFNDPNYSRRLTQYYYNEGRRK